MVKMTNLTNGNSWLWERGKFSQRRYLMQDLYQRYLDGERVDNIPKEEDPFWDPIEEVLIGTSNLFLQSLAYALDFDDKLNITDYKGQEEGKLYVNITPCNQNGKPVQEDSFVEEPSELLNRPYHFKISIRSAEIKQIRFSKGIQVKYRVKNEKDWTHTEMITGTLEPEFKHSRIISFENITQEHLDWFENGMITFLVMGVQEDSNVDPKLAKMTTKEMRHMEQSERKKDGNQDMSNGMELERELANVKAELKVLEQRNKRLTAKEQRIKNICKEWQKKPDEEKNFQGFFNAVSAAVNSSGSKLKTRVLILNRILKGHRLIKQMSNPELLPSQRRDHDTKVSNYNVTDVQGSRACVIQ